MKRKIFVNGDMNGKGATKLVVIQYKKDKFAGYIYGDTKNEKKSFTASSVEKIEKDSNWEWIGPWEVVKHPKAIVYNLGEDGIPAPAVRNERYAHCSEELRKYCTTPGRCKLALHLLAGPIERLYAKWAGNQYTGSSIMQIDLKKTANTNGFERAAAYSFARDLSDKNVHWKLKLPVYMPENNRMPRIKDNAYIKDTCGKKLRFSAVYPDGAVVLDNRVLETTDTVKFIRENPHCMVVLIGARPTKLGNMSVEVITAEELGATSVDWDTECLHWMTQAFSAEAAQRHKVKPAVPWAKGMVDEKLESSNQRFDSKLYATELYLTTAYFDRFPACWRIIQGSYAWKRGKNGLIPISKTAATAISVCLIKTIRKRICRKRFCSPWMISPSCLRSFVRMTARMQSCSRRKLSSSAKGKRVAAA